MNKLVILLLLGTQAFGWEVYFSPSKDCENKIINLINGSQESIEIAIYSFTNQGIADALMKANSRKIKIKVITDKLQASQKGSQIQTLIDHGIEVKINNKVKLEHDKFAIYDGETISTGSYNWTKAASDSNAENCLFEEDQKLAKKYSDHFKEMWTSL